MFRFMRPHDIEVSLDRSATFDTDLARSIAFSGENAILFFLQSSLFVFVAIFSMSFIQKAVHKSLSP